MDLSIIIVNYNAGPLLARCVESILASDPTPEMEIHVVDNASQDGSLERLPEDPRIQITESPLNLGFASAVNLGLRAGRGRYFLLLNPDSELPTDTLSRMVSFLDREPRAGLAGCRVENYDGSLQPPCRRRLPRPAASLFKLIGLARLIPGVEIARAYEMGEPRSREPEPVEAISGAFMMGRHELLDRVGVLDESFFLYGEDLDYCLRVARSGFEVFFVPDARVIHHRGQSRLQLPRRSIVEAHRSMRIYYDKHLADHHGVLVNALIRASIHLRRFLVLVLVAVYEPWRRTLMAVGPPPKVSP